MASVQRKQLAQNPYTLEKLDGHHLCEAGEDAEPRVDTLPYTDIEGTSLTRVKEDKASYAIGDSKGNPITDFDFVFVSLHVRGDDDPKIEVITKEGEARWFDVNEHILLECGGAAVGGMAGAAAAGAAGGAAAAAVDGGLPTADSIGVDTVGPKVGPDGSVSPMSAIVGCGRCERRCPPIPRGAMLFFGGYSPRRKKRRKTRRNR